MTVLNILSKKLISSNTKHQKQLLNLLNFLSDFVLIDFAVPNIRQVYSSIGGGGGGGGLSLGVNGSS